MAKQLSEEKKNFNYIMWTKKLAQYSCCSEKMLEELGDRIRVASFSMNNSSGSSYEGALLDVVLNNLCVIAAHLYQMMQPSEDGKRKGHPELSVNKDSLMRVLLLQHIAKIDIFRPETSDWKIKNGTFYKFNDDLPTSLKLGERSIYLCMKYGVTLTEEEFEAMRIIDRDDEKMFQHTTPLAMLVKTANNLTMIECYRTMNHKIEMI